MSPSPLLQTFVPVRFSERKGIVQNLVVVVAVALNFFRIIKSVVTGQAPVTLELRNTPGKKHIHTEDDTRTYITAEAFHASAFHASARNIKK